MSEDKREVARRLRLFFNGFDYVVAEDPGGAASLTAIHFGENTPEALRGDILSQWKEFPRWESLPLLMVDGIIVGQVTPMAETVSHSANFWIEQFGIGYLASARE